MGPTSPHTACDKEREDFLQLYDETWLRHRPDVVVTFGGGSLTLDVLRRAKARGAATVFVLHNLHYSDRSTFADADAAIVASRFAAEHYRSLLGLECTVLPNPVDFERACATERLPTFAVFVNPTVCHLRAWHCRRRKRSCPGSRPLSGSGIRRSATKQLAAGPWSSAEGGAVRHWDQPTSDSSRVSARLRASLIPGLRYPEGISLGSG
jgi:hypothetical protein